MNFAASLRLSLLGLACSSVFAMAQTSPAPDISANPFAKDLAAPAAGKALFDKSCNACHGAGGSGPALNTGIFRHGNSDNDIFQTIKGGVPGTQMPSFAQIPSDDVWRLATYIKSLSGQTGAAGAAMGDATAGAAVFFGAGGCSACHEVNGRGSDFAADLSAEGSKAVAAIRTGVLHQLPQARGGTGAYFADVATNDGQTVHGLVRNQDALYLQLETADGKWTTFDKQTLKSFSRAADAQPHDVASRVAAKDIDNLVAFLGNQKRRDFSQTVNTTPTPVVPYARLARAGAEPQNWLTYWGGYNGQHFSDLTQVTAANAGQLQARWTASLAGPNGITEATPIVVDGVMYISGAPGDVYAYDAKTGLQIWAFRRKQDIKNPNQNNPYNRGVAVLDGRVFFGTLDDNLIALDAHTGRELWETRTADTLDGYQLSGAPLAVDGKIIMGMSGGELGVRGYLDAYDPATGKRLWRTFTIPGPGEPGNKSWPGDSWKTGGGPTWLTGSYDPELHLLYWGTGNPGPDYNSEMRKGDNLNADSVLAIDPDTGSIKWHYQFTPNDGHDWDSEEDYVLADKVVDGKMRKVLLHADRNGMFYMLDRTNGQLLLGKPFVKVTWNLGFDRQGRPIVDHKTDASPQGSIVYPATGGTNFQAPSYDSQSGLFFLQYVSAQGFAQSAPVIYEKGNHYGGRGAGLPPPAPPPEQGIEAIDSSTGAIVWKFPMSRVSLGAGVIATRGGVLFVASAEGQFIALDTKTGKPLWHFRINGIVNSSPMSYAVDGKQFFAVTAANTIYTFALPD